MADEGGLGGDCMPSGWTDGVYYTYKVFQYPSRIPQVRCTYESYTNSGDQITRRFRGSLKTIIILVV